MAQTLTENCNSKLTPSWRPLYFLKAKSIQSNLACWITAMRGGQAGGKLLQVFLHDQASGQSLVITAAGYPAGRRSTPTVSTARRIACNWIAEVLPSGRNRALPSARVAVTSGWPNLILANWTWQHERLMYPAGWLGWSVVFKKNRQSGRLNWTWAGTLPK